MRFRRSLPSRMKTRQATMMRYHVARAASMQMESHADAARNMT